MGAYNSTIDDVINSEYVTGTITVGTSQVLASINASTNLTSRQEIVIYNKSANIIYYGPTGVTTVTGIPINPGEVCVLQYGFNINVYLISAATGNSIIIQELA